MKQKGFFSDFKIHLICIILVVVAELIGIRAVRIGPISFSLLPMLFALVMGVFLSQIKPLKIISYKDMVTASPFIGISVMYLIAYLGTNIGPNIHEVLNAGVALIAQELGNVGTVIFALPVGVLLLKMDRTVVGSSFSISREGSLAIIADLYGLDSPEGRGVMGSYITGTLLGTIFNAIMVSLLINVPWFLPEALAMACGTGSASMMTAALGPLIEAYPEKADLLSSFAASSQVLTSIDGMYMSLFVAIPFANWLYRKLKGKAAIEEENRFKEERKAKIKKSDKEKEELPEEEYDAADSETWKVRIKVLIYSGIFSLIANWISTTKNGNPVTPLEALPGLLWLLGIIIIGNLMKELMDRKIQLPNIIYISLIGTIASIPGLWPGASALNAAVSKISLLPLCTPILAYAGISTGKDMVEFKKQGIRIIIVTLLTFIGTYVSSAIIANIILKIQGIY